MRFPLVNLLYTARAIICIIARARTELHRSIADDLMDSYLRTVPPHGGAGCEHLGTKRALAIFTTSVEQTALAFEPTK